MKVFLGGTCGKSTWREELMPELDSLGIEYFNLVIKGRKRIEADQKNEINHRENCDCVLYVITSDIRGVYSIAEVIDDSNKRPDKTVYCYLPGTVDKPYPLKGMEFSLDEVGQMVKRNGGTYVKTWNELLEYFRKQVR